MKDETFDGTIFVFLLILIAVIILLVTSGIKYIKSENATVHSDDVEVTEWISPDGVHYWYKSAGYGSMMLAPRYDNDGELVIDKEN